MKDLPILKNRLGYVINYTVLDSFITSVYQHPFSVEKDQFVESNFCFSEFWVDKRDDNFLDKEYTMACLQLFKKTGEYGDCLESILWDLVCRELIEPGLYIILYSF